MGMGFLGATVDRAVTQFPVSFMSSWVARQVVRDAKFDLEAIAVACDNDLGPYENILLQVQ